MKALYAKGLILQHFKKKLGKAKEFQLCMALITDSGLALIDSPIKQCLEKGGRGSVLFGVDLPTQPTAIKKLFEIAERYKPNFTVKRFQSGKTFFHPKFCVFIDKARRKTAILGSSNLTGGGLSDNYEANVFIDEPRAVQQLLDYFEEHFEGAHAKTIDQYWLDQYQQLWVHRRQVEGRQRKLRERARKLGGLPTNVPDKVKGHSFAFTGKIEQWPRKKLYPYVEGNGGHVARRAASMAKADCLVQGEILGGRESTRKLVEAHKRQIPVITEEQFLNLAGIAS